MDTENADHVKATSIKLERNEAEFVLQLIGVMSARGAIKPEEFSNIGAFHSMLIERLNELDQ